jgi:2-keto-4-pentenoate hydratase
MHMNTNRLRFGSIIRATILCAAVSLVLAKAPSERDLKQCVADFFGRKVTKAFGTGLTVQEAQATQARYVAELSKKLGKPVGYKVGLVTKEAQAKFGVNAPVAGVLLEQMLLQSGTAVPANYGVHPLCEADLLVVVKDAGINQAKTPLEALQHLSEVVAFIELPDLIVDPAQKLDGGLFTALNVGARLGVVGERIPVQPTPQFVEALASMQVRLTDQLGADLGRAEGRAILGNPLNAVLWLAQDLKRHGGTLKAGDVLSLGSLKALEPQPNQTVTVTYDGLPGGPIKASLRFAE